MIAVARLLLAAVFAVAAIAKLADLRGSRRSLKGFGVPDRLVSPLSILLPAAELAIAAALVPGASARYAAAATAAMLVLFAAAIAFARARGRMPDCHCFGQLHSAPAGWLTAARNAALAVVAVGLALQSASNPSVLEASAAGAVIIVSAQAILLIVLLRRYGRALGRIEELEARPAQNALEVGAEAPAFTLARSDGSAVTLDGMLARTKPVLLVFSSSSCAPCSALLPRVAEWQERLTEVLTVALIEDEPVIAEWYGVEATPSAVLVGTDGKIAHALVGGAKAIEKLVRSVTPHPESRAEPERNGRGRVATVAALAGGVAFTAAAAHASPDRTSALEPELQAIDDVLRGAGPRLVSASRRSLKAVRVQAMLPPGKGQRAKQTAAKQALAAERLEVLSLRDKVDRLAETSTSAHNVKMIVHRSLTLLAQSLQKRERAIGASPKVALRLLKEGQLTFLSSIGSSAAAGKLLGRGP